MNPRQGTDFAGRKGYGAWFLIVSGGIASGNHVPWRKRSHPSCRGRGRGDETHGEDVPVGSAAGSVPQTVPSPRSHSRYRSEGV